MTHPEPERRLKTIAKRYEAAGYSVMISPSGEDLPEALAGLSVDILASRSGENVVVEVSSSLSKPAESRKVQQILERVGSMPNWRVDFAVSPSRDSERNPERLTRYSRRAISARLKDARDLEGRGEEGPAFMLAWTVVEAALSHLWSHDVALDDKRSLRDASLPPNVSMEAMTRLLVEAGAFTNERGAELREAAAIRNTVVHGINVRGPFPSVDAVERLVRGILAAGENRKHLVPFEKGQELLGAVHLFMQSGAPKLVAPVLDALAESGVQNEYVERSLVFFDAVHQRARGTSHALRKLAKCVEFGEPWRGRALHEEALYAFGRKDYSRAVDLTTRVMSANTDGDVVVSSMFLKCMCLIARNQLDEVRRLVGEFWPMPLIAVETRARNSVHEAIVMFALGEQGAGERAIDFLFQAFRLSHPSGAYPVLQWEMNFHKALFSLMKTPVGQETAGGGTPFPSHAREFHGLTLCTARNATILRSCSPAKRALVDLTQGWTHQLTLEVLERRLLQFENLLYKRQTSVPA